MTLTQTSCPRKKKHMKLPLNITYPLRFHIAPEKWWLEDYVKLGEGNYYIFSIKFDHLPKLCPLSSRGPNPLWVSIVSMSVFWGDIK